MGRGLWASVLSFIAVNLIVANDNTKFSDKVNYREQVLEYVRQEFCIIK